MMGNDCKHEPEVVVEHDDWGILCKKCGRDIDDYVILTKASFQLREDVIEAAWEIRNEYTKGFSLDWGDVSRLAKALDAVKGGSDG